MLSCGVVAGLKPCPTYDGSDARLKPSPTYGGVRRAVADLMAYILLLCAVLIGAAAPVHAQHAPAGTPAQHAWRALEDGRLDEAAVRFREALYREPRDASLHLGAGLVAHLLNQPAEARATLEEAVRLDPRLTEAALLLGHLAHRQGDLGTAIRVYEQALAHAPGHALIKDKLARWQVEAELHGRFEQRLGNHFTVLFEGATDQRLAERTLEALEAAYWRIGTELAIYPAAPITVVLYTERQFADVTRSPAWAAAAFDGTIRVPVRGALEHEAELERLLAHEVTHALVWSVASAGVPFWLGEGLAVLFERGEQATGTGEEPGPDEPLAGAVPLRQLHGPFGGFSTKTAEAAYAHSARATRALLDLIGPVGIASLLMDVGAGIPFETAFAARVPMSYAEFEGDISAPHD
jgi:tetratricopeptide (TPR) repeat protein